MTLTPAVTPDDPRLNLAAELLPIACELIGSVRDFGPEVVADVLARVPDGRHDALAVVLAAMVDPDAKASDLLAWTTGGPVQSRSFTPRSVYSLPAIGAAERNEAAERRATIQQMRLEGHTVAVITARLGVSRDTVKGVLRRHGAALAEAAS